METSDVRRRVAAAIERAKRASADRKTQNDEASRDYRAVLDRMAIPIFRQVVDSLKSEGYAFQVFTPAGTVRLVHEQRSDDFIELMLDTTGETPTVLGRSSVARGSRIVTSEQPIGQGAVRDVTETDVLEFVATALEAFVR